MASTNTFPYELTPGVVTRQRFVKLDEAGEIKELVQIAWLTPEELAAYAEKYSINQDEVFVQTQTITVTDLFTPAFKYLKN